MASLNSPIFSLNNIGQIYCQRLKKLGIFTIEDLLNHFPSRYEDRSKISKIKDLKYQDKATLIGKIISFKNVYTRNGKRIQKAIFVDETGKLDVIWYNQPFLSNILRPETSVSLFGQIDFNSDKPILESPEYEIIRIYDFKINNLSFLNHTGRLVPVYPETYGISSKWLRTKIKTVLFKLNITLSEFLPNNLIQKYSLMDLKIASKQIHFPDSPGLAKKAINRLSFNELFILQLVTLQRKMSWNNSSSAFKCNMSKFQRKIDKFKSSLPFILTNSQINATNDILKDISSDKPMNRLLEGDVGSGKTVVATIAAYASFLNGYQTLIMAPTEILAHQHYKTMSTLLKNMKIKLGLVSRNNKIKPEEKYDILIGTHAILTQKFKIKKLGLIVIDEQQKFGVEQRSKLRKKSVTPHVLTMTATPIPRTIALTIYADLDISLITELPPGRQKVKTWVVPLEKRKKAYKWIYDKIISNFPHQQVFLVCPFIDESESLKSVKAATKEFEFLKNDIFPDLNLGLLHGKLKMKHKSDVLENFKKGIIDILVTTPVVEVGIDNPNATIMIVEASDRFGLAQLHQLRGRVGRGDKESFCLLFSESNNPKTIERIKLLERFSSGAILAEYDLKLRGAGEIYGTNQHGHSSLKIADISDHKMIEFTRKISKSILDEDNKLINFPLLRDKLQKYTIKSVSPD